jgi:hypothetical protein
MGYSNFKKIKTVIKKFGLNLEMADLFNSLELVEPSIWLKESLRKAALSPATNEKSKSERIITPILLEIADTYSKKISFFSGEHIDMKPEDDLAGECDFFFALQSPKPYIEAPIISLAEAKDEDMEWGIAQCAAQIYGAKLFNEAEGKNIPVLHGAATDGVEWQFMRFEDNVYYLDNKIYTDLREILGVWHKIMKFYV